MDKEIINKPQNPFGKELLKKKTKPIFLHYITIACLIYFCMVYDMVNKDYHHCCYFFRIWAAGYNNNTYKSIPLFTVRLFTVVTCKILKSLMCKW